MNVIILDMAAVYVNAYREGCEKRNVVCDKSLLRKYVTAKFGAVYAATLCQ